MTFNRRLHVRRADESPGRRAPVFDQPPPVVTPPSGIVIPPGLVAIGPAPYLFGAPIPTTQGTPLSDGSGWVVNNNKAGTLVTVNGVLVFNFPTGFVTGASPGQLQHDHPGAKKHYIGFGLQWGVNTPVNMPGVVKTCVLMSGGGNIEPALTRQSQGWQVDAFFYNGMHWQDSKYPGNTTNQASRNAQVWPNATYIDPTKPHVLEYQLDYAGTFSVKCDGVVVMALSGLTFPADAGITETQLYVGGALGTVVQQPCQIIYGVNGLGVTVAGA